MRELAGDQIRHGGQANVWMRTHIGTARHRRGQLHWADVIEKDERPDHAASDIRQHAADTEAAEITLARRKDEPHCSVEIRVFFHLCSRRYFFCAACSCILRSWPSHSAQS